MTSNSPARLGWATLWGDLMRKKAFDDALTISRLTLPYAIENGDTDFEQEINEAILKTTEEIACLNLVNYSRLTGDKCSFCGLSPPRVRLGVGPNVRICNECVISFSEVFNAQDISRL